MAVGILVEILQMLCGEDRSQLRVHRLPLEGRLFDLSKVGLSRVRAIGQLPDLLPYFCPRGA
jgi:hypothetical protein